ncbi:hypothetical protein [Brevibacillus brevis]|uniref:hypothetical protein n=1 Tax=Brevibacillus brevis TaxID=1393 RepID=UPI000D0F16B4|nr:hypothetical protein [Brevibacillus brevis]PSJ67855.1 hypothetical protein C7J99_18750 [Brevibacillus brevis]RED22900.1 hypothetical protein DES34_116109 [Brevibacillus brevis]GEC91341.1 hypothetical protein BBR01nite_36720 [Brevibacillus brevis]VEF87773.1 Uncharacterised protein [Brevibacillus brevis]
MTANLTEQIFKGLSAGELQRLAVDLLPRLYNDWGPISQNGIVEGTNQTRKGTPDAWCEREDGSYVCIQATGDSGKGKVKEDLIKSVTILVEKGVANGALCIAFLRFDPHPEEIIECKELCSEEGITFEYYTNSGISKLLDDRFQDLRHRYLKLESHPPPKTNVQSLFTLDKPSGSQPSTCARFMQVLNWGELTPKQYQESLNEITEFYKSLAKLNLPSRRFFAALVELATPAYRDYMMCVSCQEVENSLSMTVPQVMNQMVILEKYGFGSIDSEEYPPHIYIQPASVRWQLLQDLKAFAEHESINLREILVNLHFTLLD